MKRHGECDMCGWCCEILATGAKLLFPLEPMGKDYLEARGIEIVEGRVGYKQLDIIDPCQHLCEDKTCAIHDTKPQYCRDWPRNPEDVIGHPCTYWFELDDGRRVGGTRSPYPTYPS